MATLDDTPGALWKFSALELKAEGDGSTRQNVFLDQPLRASHYSHLSQSDNIIPEAFDELTEGVNCACHQIAAHLGRDLKVVTEEMGRY